MAPGESSNSQPSPPSTPTSPTRRRDKIKSSKHHSKERAGDDASAGGKRRNFWTKRCNPVLDQLPELVGDAIYSMNSQDSQTRKAALQMLLDGMQRAKPYASHFAGKVAVILSNDLCDGARVLAARALESLGDFSAHYVSVLVYAVHKDAHPATRSAAVKAMGAIGRAAVPHAQALWDVALHDGDSDTRKQAAEVLNNMGTMLATKLPSEGKNKRSAKLALSSATAAPGKAVDLGTGGPAVSLPSALVTKAPRMAIGLSAGGEGSSSAPVSSFPEQLVSMLSTSLKDKRDVERLRAVEALKAMGDMADVHVQTLVEIALYDKKAGVRAAAVRTLKALNKEVSLEGLSISELSQGPRQARINAAASLGFLGKSSNAEVLYKATMEDPDMYARFKAARALGDLGEEAEWQVKVLVAQALGQTAGGDVESIATSVTSMGEQQLNRKRVAITAGELPSFDQIAQLGLHPGLAGLSVAKSKEQRPSKLATPSTATPNSGGPSPMSTTFLGETTGSVLGIPGISAQTDIVAHALKDEQELAVAAIGALSPDAVAPHIMRLVSALKGDDQISRRGAAQVFDACPHIGTAFVPVLVSRLNDKDTAVRKAMAQTLGKLGIHAVEHIQALEEMSDNDPDYSTRRATNHAVAELKRIQQRYRPEGTAASKRFGQLPSAGLSKSQSTPLLRRRGGFGACDVDMPALRPRENWD